MRAMTLPASRASKAGIRRARAIGALVDALGYAEFARRSWWRAWRTVVGPLPRHLAERERRRVARSVGGSGTERAAPRRRTLRTFQDNYLDELVVLPADDVPAAVDRWLVAVEHATIRWDPYVTAKRSLNLIDVRDEIDGRVDSLLPHHRRVVRLGLERDLEANHLLLERIALVALDVALGRDSVG